MNREGDCPINVLCRLNSIMSLEREKAIADRALARHARMGRVLFCMRNIEHPACFYGHANVRWEEEDEFNFKFCGALQGVLEQRLLNSMIRDKRLDAIITPDSELLTILERAFVPRAYSRLLHLSNDDCNGSCSVSGLRSADPRSMIGRLFSR